MISNAPAQIYITNQYSIEEGGRIKKVGCQSPPIFFPMQYTSQLASLVEALKTEGYWKNDGFGCICNSNKSLIDHIQTLIEELGIHITKELIIRVKVGPGIGKDVAIFKDGKALKFHVQKHKFKDTKIRMISFRASPASEKYLLKIGENNLKELSIKFSEDGVEAQCELPAFAYINLKFRSLTFSCLLRDCLRENGGKKSAIIRLNKLIKTSPPNVIMAAFSMLVDCEGTIDHYSLFRRIRVRMTNKHYLMDWQKLLNSLGIKGSIRKDELYQLCIEGIEDFRKLLQYGFCLHHSAKRFKFQKLLNSYKRVQVSRNNAMNFYLKELKEIDHRVTAKELASIVQKSKRVVIHYLKKLSEKGLITVEKNSMPYHYSV